MNRTARPARAIIQYMAILWTTKKPTKVPAQANKKAKASSPMTLPTRLLVCTPL